MKLIFIIASGCIWLYVCIVNLKQHESKNKAYYIHHPILGEGIFSRKP